MADLLGNTLDSREMFLGCIGIGTSWWLSSDRMVFRAINDKFDS